MTNEERAKIQALVARWRAWAKGSLRNSYILTCAENLEDLERDMHAIAMHRLSSPDGVREGQPSETDQPHPREQSVSGEQS